MPDCPRSTSVGDETAAQAVERSVAAMDEWEPHLKAMITRTTDVAAERAAALDALRKAGEASTSLQGVTVVLKDVIDEKGVRTTNGANFPSSVATRDAEVTRRLRAAGAVFVGKANLHEFAYGGTTQNPFWGSCRNPWDTSRIPGGSSGGSAAAVAAGYCDLSLGTDTAGSGRLPAALTGITALRPTLGRISNRGVTPCSRFFDTVSPMARSVSLVARAFGCLAGYDPEDPLSVDRPVAPLDVISGSDLGGVRIGIAIGPYFDGGADPGVERAVGKATETLRGLGAICRPIVVPEIEDAPTRLETLFHTDAAAFHRDRMEKKPELFGDDIRERLATLGGSVTGIDYSDALLWVATWRRTLERLFENVDAIIMPAAPAVAPLVADCRRTTTVTRRLARYCYPWSVAGGPSLSVPCGRAEHNLPCGLLLAGRWCDEATILRIGAAYQAVTDWHRLTPPAPAYHGVVQS
jgi:aspartyl-tRNA(Asn)/glutamyl-tRNA(Gln) amidotransferase subunit A